MKKSFRGKLKDGEVETIRLSTNNGLIGYKIVKLQLIAEDPATDAHESVVQIFTTNNDETGSPRSASAVIDFTDPTLLAVGFYENAGGGTVSKLDIIFDNMTVNQDIYITHNEKAGAAIVNYYLELEQMKLSDNEAAVATLKDMRAGPDTRFGP